MEAEDKLNLRLRIGQPEGEALSLPLQDALPNGRQQLGRWMV